MSIKPEIVQRDNRFVKITKIDDGLLLEEITLINWVVIIRWLILATLLFGVIYVILANIQDTNGNEWTFVNRISIITYMSFVFLFVITEYEQTKGIVIAADIMMLQRRYLRWIKFTKTIDIQSIKYIVQKNNGFGTIIQSHLQTKNGETIRILEKFQKEVVEYLSVIHKIPIKETT